MPVALAVELPEVVPLGADPLEPFWLLVPVEEELPPAEDDEDFLQVRSYKGALLRFEPTMPKLGLGTVGSASCRVYHQVL